MQQSHTAKKGLFTSRSCATSTLHALCARTRVPAHPSSKLISAPGGSGAGDDVHMYFWHSTSCATLTRACALNCVSWRKCAIAERQKFALTNGAFRTPQCTMLLKNVTRAKKMIATALRRTIMHLYVRSPHKCRALVRRSRW